jgi:hypothetical protein
VVPRVKGRQVHLRVGILRDKDAKRPTHTLRMQLRPDASPGEGSPRSGRRSLASESVVPFLRAALSKSLRTKRRTVRFCCEFAYSLDNRRPVFELPLTLKGPLDSGERTPDARLDGLQFSFPTPESRLDSLRISVDDSRRQVRVSFEGKGTVLLGDDPVRAVYREAERVALTFTEEVES